MKANIGIHIGILAAIGFLLAQFGGLVPLVLLVGYVLLKEDNAFLRMSVLKALGIVLAAYVLNFLIGLLPDVLFEFLDRLSRLFGADTSFENLKAIAKIEQFFTFLTWIVNTCKALLLVLLACLACGVKTIKLPVIDKLIDKYALKSE